MSAHLYFIFALPAFEIEPKNKRLFCNHKVVHFNTDNYSFPPGIDLGCYSLQSQRDLATLGEM